MRELKSNEFSFVGGGTVGGGKHPWDFDGNDNAISLGTVTVMGSLADLNGLSVGDAAAIGGAFGGAYGVGSYLAGAAGSMALGDAIALGTLAGGAIGIAAVLIGAAGVWAFYEYAT